RRESAENGDFSGPKGEFKNRFSGLKSYRDTFRSENLSLSRKSAVIVARSSRLHEICGLVQRETPVHRRFVGSPQASNPPNGAALSVAISF
ncbi:MAG: hypothetical protein ACK5GN_07105, partial [Pseudomonadota bacterium]